MLWGISWLNVTLFVADAARAKDPKDDGEDVNIKLESSEDIKNYIDKFM